MEKQNVIIIGSGPAAHAAGIYTGRALLNPIMFEGEMAGGVAAGGQLTTTTDVLYRDLVYITSITNKKQVFAYPDADDEYSDGDDEYIVL